MLTLRPPAEDIPISKTILVADDHVGLADTLSESLRKWYRVLAPVNSLTFLPLALALAPPDLLLLDLSFGKDSALALMPDLLRDYPATRIIIFTNHDEAVFERVSLRLGAHGFLSKTARVEEICNAIEDASSDTLITPEAPWRGTLSPFHPSQSAHTRAERGESIRWLLACGYTHAQIAERTHVTIKAIEYHSAQKRHAVATGKAPRRPPCQGHSSKLDSQAAMGLGR